MEKNPELRFRKKTRQVSAGKLKIGGGAPVSIQSMTNVPTEDTDACIEQIKKLQSAGADLVRLAVRDEKSIEPLGRIINSVSLPLSADIHFNYRLAIAAIEKGIAKIRLNPGNIGDKSRVKEVVKAARERMIPIRIGVNAGSINRKKYSHPTPEALVESALEHIQILEDCDYDQIVVSIKSSSPLDTVRANLMMSKLRDYPIHVGLTEAGYGISSAIQSSAVIGHLLLSGVGDTIRVSMTGDPIEEIIAAKKILEATGDYIPPLKIISCPTCGRTSKDIDLLQMAKDLELRAVAEIFTPDTGRRSHLTAAIMGCEVNGPGEAMDADAGLAGAPDGRMLLFSRGKKLRLVEKEFAIDQLIDELKKIIAEEKARD